MPSWPSMVSAGSLILLTIYPLITCSPQPKGKIKLYSDVLVIHQKAAWGETIPALSVSNGLPWNWTLKNFQKYTELCQTMREDNVARRLPASCWPIPFWCLQVSPAITWWQKIVFVLCPHHKTKVKGDSQPCGDLRSAKFPEPLEADADDPFSPVSDFDGKIYSI